MIDTLHPRLLALIDDGHDPVRLVALKTIEKFLVIAFSLENPSNGTSYLGLSSLESMVESLVLALDDPDPNIQEQSFNALSSLVDIVIQRHDEHTIDIIAKHAVNGEKFHRDKKYCMMLQQKCTVT